MTFKEYADRLANAKTWAEVEKINKERIAEEQKHELQVEEKGQLRLSGGFERHGN